MIEILKPEIQSFIYEKTGSDSSKLAFQKNPFPEVDFKIILNQIEARTKSKDKLPTWFATNNIIYPSKISVEQTSSEITANYKSEIISGENLIDLTGGFGVDDYYFSKKVNNVIHCEINSELSQIVNHNNLQLNRINIECIAGDSSEILEKLDRKFDWIYIDPSRRNESKGKVFMLKDCLPNVSDLQNFYFNFSNNILIKTAPILDISAGLSELKNVKKIHIVAVENEVKELIWEIEKDFEDELLLKTVNFTKKNNHVWEFKLVNNEFCNYSLPKKYIYEPNSAVMKSGGFYAIANNYSLNKLHQFSHLYTAETLIDFPGRIFQVEKIINYSKKDMNANFTNKKSNITTRNFPETVENIRKKWKIKEGGNDYCFFTTDINNNKIVLICTKIKI
ncbi:class I SAM-dependent methyltransferase [Flavobacterium sp. SUN052]|uniref:class I SAM-dependent methyltransferase n=1 Tax=Flavobacterium sp. SUN052 TaxID=3002441 RepID=UPI00237E7FC2|nr:class I SAM-dependent methyltransferase [Flavobacterium sp. SUN052]MEC4005144.1 class I SAM-dependent methyltransferase [Flavobacterium sp. SUN052]